ncbi:MAG: hypothetical protein RL514_2656 [Verrucomicrobiota bacterium]|jgi:hypothetical protein
MKSATHYSLLLVLLGCATLLARADAVGDYKVILDRNPFGLKPPPPPVAPPAPAPLPETPTNYKLSGITALFNPPRAMFVNQPPGKPTPEYLSLSEGQVQGSLEVLPNGINVKAGTVRVKISGEERTLSFEKDGLKAPAGPPIMTAPGVPLPPFGLPNPVPPTPGGSMVPTANTPATPYNFPVPGTAQPAGGAIPSPVPSGTSPARPLRGAGTGTGTVVLPIANGGNQTSPPQAPPVDPVVQAVTMEVHRAATKKQVDAGQLPPLPPTDLTGR